MLKTTHQGAAKTNTKNKQTNTWLQGSAVIRISLPLKALQWHEH